MADTTSPLPELPDYARAVLKAATHWVCVAAREVLDAGSLQVENDAKSAAAAEAFVLSLRAALAAARTAEATRPAHFHDVTALMQLARSMRLATADTYDDAYKALQGALYAKFAEQAQEAVAPKGYALVPLKLNRDMEDVLAGEDWQWSDLLAAAGTVDEATCALAERLEAEGDDDEPPQQVQEGVARAWMIEITAGKHAPSWLTGALVDLNADDPLAHGRLWVADFSKDASAGARFPTEAAARTAFESLRAASLLRLASDCFAITEHEWPEAAPAAQQPAAPEGMVLVPREPTDEMVAAAMSLADVEFYGNKAVADEVRKDYRAMLAASPNAPKAEQGETHEG